MVSSSDSRCIPGSPRHFQSVTHALNQRPTPKRDDVDERESKDRERERERKIRVNLGLEGR